MVRMRLRRYARDSLLRPSRGGFARGMAATVPRGTTRAVVSAGADNDDEARCPVEPKLDSPDDSGTITAAIAGDAAAEENAVLRAIFLYSSPFSLQS
jgi:hypothetical protein